MKKLHVIAWILVIIGGLNWLLIGAFGWNAVTAIVGSWPMVERAVYVLVGLSAIYEIVTHKKNCRNCMPETPAQM